TERQAPGPAQTAKDPTGMTEFPRSWRRAPPPCGYTYKGTTRCLVARLRHYPDDQEPEAPDRTCCAALRSTQSAGAEATVQVRMPGLSHPPLRWPRIYLGVLVSSCLP